MSISNCCGANIVEESQDVCSECYEHCEPIEEDVSLDDIFGTVKDDLDEALNIFTTKEKTK